MKKPTIVLLCLAVVPLVHAADLEIKGYIKPDPIRGNNHYLISNGDGQPKGRIKPDPLWPGDSGRYMIIDKDGNESGRIRQDYLNKGRYFIETVQDD